jgi:antimicrobial peptide system SdpB family protein
MQTDKNQSQISIVLEKYSSKNIIGFSRTLIATGMLLTLIFNNIHSLLTPGYLQTLDLPSLKFRVNFFLLFHSAHIVDMQVVAIIILVIIISGYFMQITALFHFWIAASFYMLKPLNIGGDSINLLLTLLLIPVCLFDERKNHWSYNSTNKKLNRTIQNIFLVIIKLQVAYIYFDAFFRKLQVREWRDGTMIYYWFAHNFFGLNPAYIKYTYPLLTSIPVLLILAWGSMLLEALIATGLFLPDRYKMLLLKYAIIFHIGIMLIHGFSSFFFAMSGGLFLYLYPAKERFALSYFIKSNRNLYHNIQPLQINVFLVFYCYLVIVLIIANLLPVSVYTSWFEIIFTLAGIFLLFMHPKRDPLAIGNRQWAIGDGQSAMGSFPNH